MKKMLVVGLVVGVVAILATATLVTAWGGIRALRAANVENSPGERGRGYGAKSLREDVPRGSQKDLASRRYPHAGDEVHEWLTIEGKVLVGTDMGSDIVIETADGTQVEVGTGPGWLTSQGFELNNGDRVTVKGFWEDGEFKAGEIARQGDGVKIALRDENGRPLWAGTGRRAVARQEDNPSSGPQSGARGRRWDGREGREEHSED